MMATKSRPTATKKDDTKSEATIKNNLYSRANTILRERRQAEFHEILGGLYKEAGLEYKRRLTPEEKAAKTVEELYERYPSLRPAVGGDTVPAGGVAAEDAAVAAVKPEPAQ